MSAYEQHGQNGRAAPGFGSGADELAWTALQYSLGELPDDEAARFETRLEADSAAQTALAQAVALSAGIKLAEESTPAQPALVPTVTRPDEYRGRRVAGWLLLATAASVALWFAAAPPRVQPGRDVANASGGEAQHALAAAWADGQSTDEELAIVEETMSDDELSGELEAYPVIEEPSAPDWLIAALVDAQSSPVRGEN